MNPEGNGNGDEASKQSGGRWKPRLKKLGIAGFLFFLLKGLVWLAVGYFVVSETID